jgi:hypothetical protein
LLGIADQQAGIVVDYSKSAEEIYEEVCNLEFGPIAHESYVQEDYLRFCSLLRRVLRLAEH